MDDFVQWIFAFSKRLMRHRAVEVVIVEVIIIGIIIGTFANWLSNHLDVVWDFIVKNVELFVGFALCLCLIIILLLFYSHSTRSTQEKSPAKKTFVRTKVAPLRFIVIFSILLLALLTYIFLRFIPGSLPPPKSLQAHALCDRNCVIDDGTINHSLKEEAQSLQVQGDNKAACEHWYWASLEDSTDGEAKIAYQNYHMSHQPDPCGTTIAVSAYINLAVIVQMMPGNDVLNSRMRAMIQAMALRQQEFNDAHSSGPMLHLFLLNVGDDVDQSQVAQQVLAATKGPQPIVGVVLLTYSTEPLIDELNKDKIPMVAVTAIDSNIPLPYLRSVAPSFQAQADVSLHIIESNSPQNANPPTIALLYRSGDVYNTNIASFFQREAQNANVQVYARSYTDADINTQLVEYIKQFPGLSTVYFAGPPDDFDQFSAALNNENIHIRVLGPDSMYQWVYQSHTAEQIRNFQSLQFTAFAYHDFSAIHDNGGGQCAAVASIQKQYDAFDMAADYKTDFDPGGVYFGGSYTHDVASSDTILAYDAIALLDTAAHSVIEDTKQVLTTQTLLQALQKFTPTNPFPGVSGQISYQQNQSVPYQKAVLLITVNGLGGNSITQLKGSSATVWGGCYTFHAS